MKKPTKPGQIITGQRITQVKLSRAREMRRSMTPSEKRLWQHLRKKQLNGHHFRRQQIIDGFIVDFYCHTAGLIIEVDGPVHESQAGYDAARGRVIARRGLRILRITNEDIQQNISDVLNRIAEACRI